MKSRREFISLMGMSGAMIMVNPSYADANVVGQPAVISGPIRGGKHGWPFGAYLGDISKIGYVEEEYFLDGTATRFTPDAPLGIDGKWSVTPAGTAPFRTRFIVRRPVDAARFNGTVLVEWINVSAGSDTLVHDLPGIYESGFAYVAVSTQHIGLYGMGNAPVGLTQWDSDRYGSLSHPGDSYSYDIYTQAAALVGPHRPKSGVDPLPGLDVKRLIAVGASQSAMRLTTYINAIHPRSRLFDGFLAAVSFGVGSSFDDRLVEPDKLQNLSPAEWVKAIGAQARIRDDLDVPVFIINSETETLHNAPTRRPDTDHFRFWEIAGAAHVSLPMLMPLAQKTAREFGQAQASMGATSAAPVSVSHLSWAPTVDSGTQLLDRWIRTGQQPSHQPLIELQADGADVARDADGNALGGVRLPEMAAPAAQNDGLGNGLFGHHKDFSSERLRELYPTHEAYVAKVKQATEVCERDGTLLAAAAKASIDAAQAASIPA